MRPPRIRTDISRLLDERARGRREWRQPRDSTPFLLTAGLQRDRDRLEARAVYVDAADVVLQVLQRRLRQRSVVRAGVLRLLDHLVLQGDRRRPLEGGRIHDPDAQCVRPDELVDLVHLPQLVTARKRSPILENDVRTLLHVIAAVDPAAVRGGDEPCRDVAMAAYPALLREE